MENDGMEWAHLLVFIAPEKGTVPPSGREVLAQGRLLADALGAYLWVYWEGGGEAARCISLGADRVFVQEKTASDWRERAEALGSLIEQRRPEIVLGAEEGVTPTLFGWVAQLLNTGLLTDSVRMDIDPEERLLLAVKPLYGGKLLSEWFWPERRPQMVLLRPGIFPEPLEDPGREGEVETLGGSG